MIRNFRRSGQEARSLSDLAGRECVPLRSSPERALAVAVHAPGRLRARALIGLAHMHYFQARYVETVALATEALSLGREENDAWVVSFALFMQGLAALERGDHEEAAARSLEAREAANASNDADLHGGPLLILANLPVSKGEHHRAQQLYDESIEVCRRTGETWGPARMELFTLATPKI